MAFGEFVLTTNTYWYRADHAAAVQAEFGPGATEADWNEIAARFTGQIAEFCDAIGLGHMGTFMVLVGGHRFWPHEPRRRYFAQRHNGNRPSYFLAHANIDNFTLTLGSWWGLNMRILAKRPPVPTVATHPATEIRRTSAKAHGEITDVGIALCDERGFEWGTSSGSYPNSVTETQT